MWNEIIFNKQASRRAKTCEKWFYLSFSQLLSYWPVERDFLFSWREATRGKFHGRPSVSRVLPRFSIETAPCLSQSRVSMVIPGYEAARKINGTKSSYTSSRAEVITVWRTTRSMWQNHHAVSSRSTSMTSRSFVEYLSSQGLTTFVSMYLKVPLFSKQ